MEFYPRIDAIYARQSIDKADSISIESQIEMCQYETRGASFQVFSDKGYSGKNTQRPEFQRMLLEIRRGKIQRVICYKLDRCSRSIVDFATLMEEFQRYGVEFISCTEKFDTSTPMGRAMLNICIVFAQLERETIQQRVADAYHSRSRKGFYMGGKTPFGFRRVPCMVDGKRSSRYEPEPEEAEILQLLYEQYASSSTSLGDLVAILRDHGISNPRREDGCWVRSHIGRMLANPVYVRANLEVYRYFQEQGTVLCNDPEEFIGQNGCYLYRQEEKIYLVLGPHQGLVSSELWLKCRQKTQKAPLQKSQNRDNSWLTGKLRCGKCGHNLVISSTKRKNGKQYRYIVCPKSHGQDRCCEGLGGWKAETAEALLSVLIVERLKTDFTTIPIPTPLPDSKEIELDTRIAQLQREIEKTAAKALESGISLLPYLNDHIHGLETKKEELAQERKARTKEKENRSILPHYDRIWEDLPAKEKQRVLAALISSIRLSETAATVWWCA